MNNNLNIGNKIAGYRHEKGATQEQLADYVGVSVAAVSKWETGQSYPDITLLPSIADFFEVSIDSLLDYTIADNEKKLKQIYDSIFEPVSNGDYNTVLPITLAALKKYPNDLYLLETTAAMISGRAWTSETKEQDFKDAIKYYEQALKCAETKGDTFKVLWIKKDIAYQHDNLGDTETAIKKLNEINDSQAFTFEIARLKYKIGEKAEAKQLVQVQLWHNVFNLYRVSGELCKYYHDEGNFDMMLECQKYHIGLMADLTNDTPNYADDLVASSYSDYAKNLKNLERYDEMWKNLEKAVYHAVRFDKNSSYKINTIKFMEGLDNGNTMSTSSERLISYGILNDMRENFAEFAGDSRYIKYYEELDAAKKTKIEAGIWTE
ncbi:MAG: helix-turn-helix domain-containing protein [Oscillospiraceae bacterium]|nr:helix-turn-helix domain-containing protein [Oscillospiraceae bacterium]